MRSLIVCCFFALSLGQRVAPPVRLYTAPLPTPAPTPRPAPLFRPAPPPAPTPAPKPRPTPPPKKKTTTFPCEGLKDKDPTCQGYGEKRCCVLDEKWMSENCKLTCCRLGQEKPVNDFARRLHYINPYDYYIYCATGKAYRK